MKYFKYHCLFLFISIFFYCVADPAYRHLFANVCHPLYLMITIWLALRARRSPPGPSDLSIAGYLFHMDADYHIKLTKLADEHGPVYQIHLGSEATVVLSDYALIKDAFGKSVFAGRPNTQLKKLMQGYGVINTDGPLWKEQRAFLHRTLREFGMNIYGNRRNVLGKIIKKQVWWFLTDLSKQNSEAIEIRPTLKVAVSNVIGSVLMSLTATDDPVGFARLMFLIDDGFRLAAPVTPFIFIPWLKYVPILNRNFKLLTEHFRESTTYFSEVVQKHKETFDPENIRDFVDAFLLQRIKLEEREKDNYFSDKQCAQMLADVFSAGYETVTTLLDWSFFFLARYPEVQEKVREEIGEVIGFERDPEVKDIKNMPYTESVTYEVLRMSNVIPIGNAHAALEDTELGGYRIEKGTHILPNLWAVHMDPKLWDSPQEFRPERFLSEGMAIKPPYLMPFATGLRMCVGEVLTRMEVFLFLTYTVRYFQLQLAELEDPEPGVRKASISRKPQSYKIRASLRQDLEDMFEEYVGGRGLL